MKDQNLVEFTDEELDKIIEYMEKIGAETIQDAIIHAVTKTAE